MKTPKISLAGFGKHPVARSKNIFSTIFWFLFKTVAKRTNTTTNINPDLDPVKTSEGINRSIKAESGYAREGLIFDYAHLRKKYLVLRDFIITHYYKILLILFSFIIEILSINGCVKS